MMHSPLANCLVTVSCMCVRTWRFNHLSCIQFFIHFWNQTCFKGPSADSQTPCVSPFDLECKSPSQIVNRPPSLHWLVSYSQQWRFDQVERHVTQMCGGRARRTGLHTLVSQICSRGRQLLLAPVLIPITLHNRQLLLAPVSVQIFVP